MRPPRLLLSSQAGPDSPIPEAPPPIFDPRTEFAEARAFFAKNGYVVVNALTAEDLAEINAVADGWLRDRGAEIEFPGQGHLVFPLLEYPELDRYTFTC